MRFFDKPQTDVMSILDYRLKAQKRIPKPLFDFLEGGAFEEVTMRRNQEDFQHIQLKRRVLKEVSNLQTETSILDQKIAFPLALAPVGFAGVYSRRGEIYAAKAAEKANVPFSLSTVSICSVEEVSQSCKEPFWFQFYLFKDRKVSLELLDRVNTAKCPILLLTVDLPVAGARHRYHRSRNISLIRNFIEEVLHIRWWLDVRVRGRPLTLGNMPKSAPEFSSLSAMRQWMGSQLKGYCSWEDVEWIRKHWKGKLLIKGILEAEDAKLASKVGADGIVVSNHGGRHMDGISSTINALPSICEVVKEHLTILLDGGVTSGLDIVKALAIGADACMIGKPWIYGLATRGETGVTDVLNIFQNEMRIAMVHLGVASVNEINRSILDKRF